MKDESARHPAGRFQQGAPGAQIASGEFGHTVGKSLAMALVAPDVAVPGQELTAHVVGKERPAKVIPPSPYDPDGEAMRG